MQKIEIKNGYVEIKNRFSGEVLISGEYDTIFSTTKNIED